MKTVSFYIITVNFLFFCLACKKEKQEITFDIEGSVTDINDDSGINAASVEVSKREVSSGTFNSSYSKLLSATTGSNGQYSFSTPYGSIESFKFEVSHKDYFGKEIIINPDDLSTEETNTLNFSLQSKGYIKISITNATPFDQFDEFSFSTLNPTCLNCVKFTSIQLDGAAADTLLVGGIEANKYFKYQYFVTKNGANTNYIDSVFCATGDTTYQTISY